MKKTIITGLLGLVVACSSSNNRQQERIDMILNMFPNYDTTPMRQTSQELQSQNICFGILGHLRPRPHPKVECRPRNE